MHASVGIGTGFDCARLSASQGKHAPLWQEDVESATCCALPFLVTELPCDEHGSCRRPWQQLQASLSWTAAAKAKELLASVHELYIRHSSDDLVSMFLVLIDAYVTKVSCNPACLLLRRQHSCNACRRIYQLCY